MRVILDPGCFLVNYHPQKSKASTLIVYLKYISSSRSKLYPNLRYKYFANVKGGRQSVHIQAPHDIHQNSEQRSQSENGSREFIPIDILCLHTRVLLIHNSSKLNMISDLYKRIFYMKNSPDSVK